MQPKPGGFIVPAGGELVLQPGADHVMLMALTAPLESGTSATVTLRTGEQRRRPDGAGADVPGCRGVLRPDTVGIVTSRGPGGRGGSRSPHGPALGPRRGRSGRRRRRHDGGRLFPLRSCAAGGRCPVARPGRHCGHLCRPPVPRRAPGRHPRRAPGARHLRGPRPRAGCRRRLGPSTPHGLDRRHRAADGRAWHADRPRARARCGDGPAHRDRRGRAGGRRGVRSRGAGLAGTSACPEGRPPRGPVERW